MLLIRIMGNVQRVRWGDISDIGVSGRDENGTITYSANSAAWNMLHQNC